MKEKILSEISDDDFSLRPGELRNGDPEYKTTWDDEKPEEDDMPDDSTLYNIMEIGDANYEWEGASSIDIEVYYSGYDSDEDDETIMFSLTTDEIDNNPDPIDVIKPVAKKKPGY